MELTPKVLGQSPSEAAVQSVRGMLLPDGMGRQVEVADDGALNIEFKAAVVVRVDKSGSAVVDGSEVDQLCGFLDLAVPSREAVSADQDLYS